MFVPFYMLRGLARGDGTVADSGLLVVFVGMVQIRAVRMLVLRSLVAVRMTVHTIDRWIVQMRVTSIVVGDAKYRVAYHAGTRLQFHS